MFKCNKEFFVRYSSLPLDTLNKINDLNFKNDSLNIYEEEAKQILMSLSNDLVNAIERGSDKKDVFNSLYKYINRSSYRTTPFGLAAGVGIGYFSKEDDCKIDEFLKYLRIDMDWLCDVIKNCEKIIGEELIVVKNNTIEQNGNLYIQYWNDCFIDKESTNKKIHIKRTKYVDFIFELCKNPVSIRTLLDKSKMKYPNVQKQQFESVIQILLEGEFIISNLRVNSSCINQFKHLVNTISKDYSSRNSNLFDQLFLISKMIDKYNSECFNLNDSSISLNEINLSMNKIKKSNNNYQIDLYSKNALSLNYGIKTEVEEFANFIANFTFQSSMKKFVDVFLEKYGYQRVKYLDILKDNTLNSIQCDRSESIRYNDKLNLILLSIIEEEKKDVIDLYKYKNRFKFKHENNLKLSDSMELAFYIIKNNEKYELVTTPLGGSHRKNNIMGRFKYLYGMKSQDDMVYAVSYIPNNSHVYGVIQSILPEEKYIYYGGFDRNGLDLNDIYVGIKNMELCFYSKTQKKEIKIVQNNMATLETIPFSLKKLLELNSDNYATPISFLECIYHIIYSFSGVHFPELRYKNIVIVPESWRFDKINISKTNFIPYFENFCKKYRLPKMITAGEKDNKLYLSTQKKEDVEILYELYKKDNNIVLFKAKVFEDNLIIKDFNNRSHVGEFIFELENTDNKELLHFGDFPISEDSFFDELDIVKSKKGIFEDWIYLKLYINPIHQNYCLLYFFEKIYPKLIKDRMIDNFFYIRYKDPNDHLRLRIKTNQIYTVLPIVGGYIEELKNLNLLTKYTIEQYDPEIYRYGGIQCIGLAEIFFQQDSICALSLLEFENLKRTRFSLKQIFIISAANIMNTIGLSVQLQNSYLEQYRFKTKNNEEFIKEFEPLKNIIYLKNYNLENEDLISMQMFFDERRISLENYWKSVIEYNLDENVRLNILLSLLHMHFNRLFGVNKGLEKRLMGYLRKLINEWYSYEKYREKSAR